jgi:LPS-assembly protein
MAPTRGQAPDVSTTPPKSSVDDSPFIVTSEGTNTAIGEVYTADDNVVVHYKGDVIFADHVIFDHSTKVMIATGNARIFSAGKVYRGDSITYNLDTKAITSTTFKAADYPRFIDGKQVTTPEFNHYRLNDADFTTSNREKPSFHMHASTIEYRPNDEVVLKNVVFYVGNIPVFYFPLFVQSLTDSRPTYQFEIGDSGQFGYFMDNKYNWVASDKLRGTVNFDLREKRGYAGGLDVQYFPSMFSDMLLKTYFAQDNLYSQNTVIPGPAGLPQNGAGQGDLSNHNAYDGVPQNGRYRIAYQSYLQFGNDFSSTADLNKWSDPWITRDYFQDEYQTENQPPNFISLNQYNPNFTVSLLASPQVNPFFETVARLPEFSVESKQQKIFGTDLEYTSQSSVVNFERKFADLQNFTYPNDYLYNSFSHETTAYDFYHPNGEFDFNRAQTANYSAYRYDTYHELAYPRQYFNFLTLTPRIGGRVTYYSDDNQNLDDFSVTQNGQTQKLTSAKWRLAGDVGLSGSFKLSRTWLNVKLPNLGIDGIRHQIEPFFDSSFAPTPTATPNQIRGFDDRLYSTQLQPLDWTEYNSIDSIDRQAVVRFGVTNKLQTKRDGVNYDLLSIKTYADADFDHNFSAADAGSPGTAGTPAVGTRGTPGYIAAKGPVAATSPSTVSNLFNDVRFYESQQLTFQSLSSVALANHSYNEIDTNMLWSPDPSIQLNLGDHYLNHSPIFGDSNELAMQFFYRINEHWQFQAQEQFEANTGHLQLQQYTVYRDLDAWQLAMTYSDSELNGQGDHTVYFSLTLKAFPKYSIHTPRL